MASSIADSARAGEEAYALIREAHTTSGDIIPLSEHNPDMVRLDTETKLITHAIRIGSSIRRSATATACAAAGDSPIPAPSASRARTCGSPSRPARLGTPWWNKVAWIHPLAGEGLGEAVRVALGEHHVGVVQQPKARGFAGSWRWKPGNLCAVTWLGPGNGRVRINSVHFERRSGWAAWT